MRTIGQIEKDIEAASMDGDLRSYTVTPAEFEAMKLHIRTREAMLRVGLLESLRPEDIDMSDDPKQEMFLYCPLQASVIKILKGSDTSAVFEGST